MIGISRFDFGTPSIFDHPSKIILNKSSPSDIV
nr:MAG TPA: hypothetical protein [Bacteriophage sp.]